MNFSYLRLDRMDEQFSLYARKFQSLNRDLDSVRVDFFRFLDYCFELGGELYTLKQEKKKLCREYQTYLNEKKLEFVSERKYMEDCCKFPSRLIGHILSDIISDIEGVSYTFRETACYKNRNTRFEKSFLFGEL